jgi:hypothetical protein
VNAKRKPTTPRERGAVPPLATQIAEAADAANALFDKDAPSLKVLQAVLEEMGGPGSRIEEVEDDDDSMMTAKYGGWLAEELWNRIHEKYVDVPEMEDAGFIVQGSGFVLFLKAMETFARLLLRHRQVTDQDLLDWYLKAADCTTRLTVALQEKKSSEAAFVAFVCGHAYGIIECDVHQRLKLYRGSRFKPKGKREESHTKFLKDLVAKHPDAKPAALKEMVKASPEWREDMGYLVFRKTRRGIAEKNFSAVICNIKKPKKRKS